MTDNRQESDLAEYHSTAEHGSHPGASHDPWDDLTWGAFLIVTGAIWLLPSQRVPEGTWLIATGAILLGLNAGRHLCKLATSSFATLFGALAVVGGIGDLFGLDLPMLALTLIVVGVIIAVKPVLRRR